ncbi:hypothetical protein LEP1GSC082_0297 [Leptospira kirschneri str. H2]|nr:hypothetical protein LEP1GSC082_0297 [Leptospira kirschneri str. H2]
MCLTNLALTLNFVGTLTKLDLRVEFEICGNSHKVRFKSRI